MGLFLLCPRYDTYDHLISFTFNYLADGGGLSKRMPVQVCT
jgi:hypothetical protein